MDNYFYEITEAEYRDIVKSEKIDINRDAYHRVNRGLLDKIINDDKLYYILLAYFSKKIQRLEIGYRINGDKVLIRFNKVQITKGLEKLLEDESISNKSIIEEKMNALNAAIDYEKFIENEKDNVYTREVEGKKCSISVGLIDKVLKMSEEEYIALCSSDGYEGIKVEHLIYMIKKYCLDNQLQARYHISKEIEERISDIKKDKTIDIYSVDKINETSDELYKKIILNPELEEEIFKNIPNNGNKLEQAIYCYIKMCKLLRYDEEFYAVGQKGIATIKNKNPSYVSNISLIDNEAVCYEFNLIYTYVLNKLGINFSSDYTMGFEDCYGSGHAKLEFRVGRYIISADSVTSILDGDMIRAKQNEHLVGLKCKNINKKTQQEVEATISKMYELVNSEEESKEEESFEELIDKYSRLTDNIKNC